MSASRIALESIESAALRSNPLGDPHVRTLPVYLPPDYDSGTTRYPVVLMLAGFTGTGRAMMNEQCWEENIQQRLDRLILNKEIRPMIAVLPDAMTRYGGSQYINSSATGNYADYLLEIVRYVDVKFRTLPERDFRAITGHSSGGYGALVTAMQHPEVFGLVSDRSGDKYFEFVYKMDFPKVLRALDRFKDLPALLKNPAAVRPRGGDFFPLMNMVAMSACYSPNPISALGFDFPFEFRTGELREDVWNRWLAWDPIYMVEKYAPALKSMRLCFLECGSRDEYFIQYGCRILTERLKHLDVPHCYVEFDDGHSGVSYRYDVTLKAISNAMPV